MRPIVVFVALCAMLWPAAAQDAARMDAIVQSYVQLGSFMGSVLVVKDGKVLLDKGYGFANLEWQVPNTADSKFRIGSMTKQFTSAAIFLLQERGKLSLNDPVKKYLPEAPAAWDKITLYHLLTHTAGLPNVTELPDFHVRQRNPATPDEIISWFKDKPLDFEPGSKMQYSNSGYIVLGRVIEKASGVSYQTFLADNIFKPLGLKNTGYDSNSAVIARHASGYQPSKNGFTVGDYSDMTVPFAAGALYSTTHDLVAWDAALFGGKLLSKASLEKMTTPFLNGYACGLAVLEIEGHRVVSHGGGIPGFNTFGAYLPADTLAVVVLANVNGLAPDQIGQALAAVALGKTVTLPSERQAVAFEAKSFDAFIGNFQLAPKFVLTVSREGEHFFAQGSGQPKIEIFPSAPREFFAKVVDVTITFDADEKGRARALTVHQNGRDTPGKRVEP